MVIAEPQTIPDEIETISEEDEILLKAENYILEHGWCQDRFQDADGSVCIVGAMHIAITGRAFGPFSPQESLKIQDIVAKRLALDVVRWNDDPHTTKQDVINVLREARAGKRWRMFTKPSITVARMM